MPRYRVIKEIPETLHYTNGKVHFQTYFAGNDDWVWHVWREVIDRASVTICRATDGSKLGTLKQSGFEVPAGSPADRIMRSLVLKGYAERIPESRPGGVSPR
jgi:hypothetical protein